MSIFRGGGATLVGGGQKIFIFQVGLPYLGGDNFLGGGWYLSAYYIAGRDNPMMVEVYSGGVGSII